MRLSTDVPSGGPMSASSRALIGLPGELFMRALKCVFTAPIILLRSLSEFTLHTEPSAAAPGCFLGTAADAAPLLYPLRSLSDALWCRSSSAPPSAAS